MDITYDRKDGRSLIPVRGRYLIFTNAVQIEYLDAEERFIIPLPSVVNGNVGQGTIPDPDFGFSFILESNGFLLIDKQYILTKTLLGEFHSFEHQLLIPIRQAYKVWRPVTFKINNLGQYGPYTTRNGVYYFHQIEVQILSSVGAYSNVRFSVAEYAQPALNGLYGYLNNTVYKGPTAYPGLTLIP